MAASLLFLGLSGTIAEATNWDHSTWPPPANTADVVAALPISATVVASPPAITLNYLVPGTYQIFRKDPAATSWGTAIGTTPAAATSYTDATVSAGQFYEYKVVRIDGPSYLQIPSPVTYKGGSSPPIGYIMTGIQVDETQPRGRLVLIVANDVPANLPVEYGQYLTDLQADGWFVHVILVSPAASYDVAGTNAAATITVTAGGSGYVAGAAGTTDGSGEFRFSDANGSVALGTITVSGGAITAVAVAAGGGGGGFTVGDTLTIGGVKSGTGTGATCKVGSVAAGTGNPALIRAQVQAIYNQFPGQVKNVVLLGKVPACRTGSTFIGDPDGHEVNDGATGADGYYANMTGAWTDTGSNVAYYNEGGITISSGELNTPNDNKFDQYYMSQTGGEADLGFGRIDLSNNIDGQYEALKSYLDKLHRFKTASPDFLPGRRIILRTGGFANIDETCWTMAYGVTGDKTQIDCISDTTPPLPTEISASFSADSDYSASNGPYLCYFQGSGPPSVGVGGKAVFWTGMQSHWGWWYSSTVSSGENAPALRLGENSFCLSWTWDIFGLRYFYHRMVMGFDAGDMMRVSINNTDAVNGTYAFTTDGSSTDGGYIASCAGALFMNHFGDPTLRFFMFAPPANLSVVASSGQPHLTWTVSTEPTVTGYHIYRAQLTAGAVTGPYTRVTSTPVTAVAYADTDPTVATGTGQWSYMVRAVRLESTGSGTYYNASLGAIQAIDMTNAPATLQITSAPALPSANWNTAFTSSFTASGGTPLFTWTMVSGSLPPGLALAPNGAITGSATTEGTYAFTVKVTDALGQTAQQTFTLATLSNNAITLLPEATAYDIAAQPTRVQGPTEAMVVSAGNNSLVRFNLAGLDANNALVAATLRLYVAPGTSANCIALVQAGLTADALVNWSIATVDWNNQPPDNPAVAPATATTYPVPLNYVDIDVTPLLAATLAGNTTGKIGFRLFTASPYQTINFCSGYSYLGAIPQLIIRTTDAPKITITSPTVNPAAIYANSGLAITATVTAIPDRAAMVTQQWVEVSGPGTATFATPIQPDTTVTFSVPGTYVLQLTANDTVLQSSQNLTVEVLTAPVSGPTDSLAMRLPFDEGTGTTANDASGSGNNGTLLNGAVWSSAGKISGAVSLSNSNQQISVADSAANPYPLDGQQQMTFSVWINPAALDTDSSFRDILIKSGAYSINLRNNQVYATIGALQESAGRVAAGQWTHIALVFNGGSATNQLLYINGVPDTFSNTAYTAVPRKATAPLYIGAASAMDTHAFNGLIDEVRIYSRALTLAEVQSLASAAPTNMGPGVATNPNLSGMVNLPLALSAAVSDDGNPPPSTLTYQWNQLGGPATLTIGNQASASTSTTPSVPGLYGLQFTASDGAIATFANVTVTITGQTYAGWAAANGLTGNNALPTSVIAGDGLTNLYKYSLGLNPTTHYNPDDPALPFVQLNVVSGAGYLTLTFTGVATDVTYHVQATSDLTSGWTTIQAFSGSPAPGTVTVQDTQSTSSSPKRFMRLLITDP